MSDTSACTRELMQAIEDEIGILARLTDAASQLQTAVIEHEWVGVEDTVRAIGAIKDELQTAEEARAKAYTELRDGLSLADTAGFYDVLCRLETDVRGELSRLYRELKIAIMRVEGMNRGLGTYVNASIATIYGILEELLPERRGKIYSRTGRGQGTDDRAMVVNHSL